MAIIEGTPEMKKRGGQPPRFRNEKAKDRRAAASYETSVKVVVRGVITSAAFLALAEFVGKTRILDQAVQPLFK
jgi:hypothetical protein